MADQHDDGQSESLAWDRVGQFLQDTSAVAVEIADRNQKLWTRVSNNLRGGSYSTDAMTTDAAKAMTTAMDNLDDILMLLSRPPDHERVAMTLPTVFLRFSQAGAGWTTPDPVWIRVPYWDRKNLPRRADIYLDGAGDAVKALKDSLTVTFAHKSYRLEVADVGHLTEGVYVGVIAIGERPLANLRIVVERREQ